MKVLLTAIYILLTTGGLVLFKLGGDSLLISFKDGFTFKMQLLTFLGFCCYLSSFLLWQKLLVTFDLSYIVPLTTGIVQIIVLLIGYFVFKENINFYNTIGICLVIIGIILIGKK